MQGEAKVLLVDPDPDQLRATASALRDAGYSVFSAGSASAGLEMARTVVPEVVLLDMTLPDMDGTELCHRIKQSPGLAGTKVVHIWAPITSIPGVAHVSECDADGYLTRPVTPQLLLVTVRAMTRLKAVEDQLRRTDQLWRTLFAKTREAILLVDDGFFIIEANPKAAELFEYSIDELKRKPFLQLCPESVQATLSSRLAQVSHGPAIILQTEQMRKDGARFPADIQVRRFQRDSHSYFEMIVRNLDDDLSAEFASRAMTREIDLLTEYSTTEDPKSVTAAIYGGGPISQLLPAYFEELTAQYGRMVDLALEEKTYRIDHDLSGQLRQLAARMGRLRAAPRDVIELHTAVLKGKMADTNPRKKQAYNVEGRFMLVELLGYLATYYRDRAIGSLGDGSAV